MLGTIIYNIAKETDNTVSDVIEYLGTIGITEYGTLSDGPYKTWTNKMWQQYLIFKYSIKTGKTVHHIDQPEISEIIDEMAGIVEDSGATKFESYQRAAKTESMRHLEMGERIYPRLFFSQFKQEVFLT